MLPRRWRLACRLAVALVVHIYAAGQSNGQALIVESAQSVAAAAAKKAAKKAEKKAKRDAHMKNTECWGHVRGCMISLTELVLTALIFCTDLVLTAQIFLTGTCSCRTNISYWNLFLPY